MDIKKLIGETTEYDKKQAVEKKKIKNWCKSVSAFANTIGGSLIFGISDNDEIVGVADIKSDSEFISQKKERISPIPSFDLHFEVIDEKKLIIVDVAAGKDTPYYYVGDGTTEAYLRVGNESVAANAAELRRLVLRGVNETYDSQSSGYQLTDYAFTKLRERFWQMNVLSDIPECFVCAGMESTSLMEKEKPMTVQSIREALYLC